MTTTHTITVRTEQAGQVEVSLSDRGQGRPFLFLHGGAGPQSVTAFADQLAAARHVRVLVPAHPGFSGTPRPEGLHTIRGLAAVYIALLDELGLDDVTVAGNSIGGWIAAEMALAGSPRISSIVIIDAVGIEVPGHPVADFFSLTFPQIAELSYHDPERFAVDPETLPPAARAELAGNDDPAVYAGQPSMTDPGLRSGSRTSACPLSCCGETATASPARYGRAYADAIPTARFHLLACIGHLPQIENPGRSSR